MAIDLNGETRPTTIENTIILGESSDSCSRFPANPSVGGNVEDQASGGRPSATCDRTT